MIEKLLDRAKQAGVHQHGSVKPSEVEFKQEIRDICKANVCRKYGTTWACPPAVGTVEECRERCLRYNTMLVFTGKFMLEDSFDYEGMVRGASEFKKLALDFEAAVKPLLKDYLMLSNESCGLCKVCTYPHAPCRFPERLHHSLEGYGVIVSDLAKQAGVNYNNGENSLTYFGALLFNDSCEL